MGRGGDGEKMILLTTSSTRLTTLPPYLPIPSAFCLAILIDVLDKVGDSGYKF